MIWARLSDNRLRIFGIDRRGKWAGSGRVWLQSGYISVSRAGVRDVGWHWPREQPPCGGSTRFSLARGNGACARHVLVQPGPRRKGRRGKTQYDPGRPRGNDTFTRQPKNKSFIAHGRVPADSRSRFHVRQNHERLDAIHVAVDHRVGVDPVLRAWNTPSSYPATRFARVVGGYPLDTPRYVGSSSFPLFFFGGWSSVWSAWKRVPGLASGRMALLWNALCKYYYMPRNDIPFYFPFSGGVVFAFSVWFAISRKRNGAAAPRGAPGISTRHLCRFAY